MTAPSPLDQLTADQPDRGEQHRRLHVVASVDRERAVRDGEEEVERDRGDDARGDARSPAADDRDPEHDEHQDQGEVRRCDMAAQRHERADGGDRDQRRASDTDHHSTMYERRAPDESGVKAPDEILTARTRRCAYDDRMSADAGNGDGRAYGLPAGTIDHDLTSVDAGTPGGELLRRYWHPVALSEEATDLPRAIRVLGEDLVLFRDRSGNPGLVYPRCVHRGTTLLFGRVEDVGIRCCYHGWLFDSEGRCLDQPCEPDHGCTATGTASPGTRCRSATAWSSRTSALPTSNRSSPATTSSKTWVRVSVWWPTAQASDQAARR